MGLVWLLTGCGGPDPLQRVLSDLRSPDREVRRTAMRELGQLQPPFAQVQAAIERAAKDPDPEVRRLVCRALGEIPDSDPALQLAALEDGDLSVQLAAAFTLLDRDAAHEGARRVLQRAMQQGEGGVIVAVTRRGPHAAWAAPTLIALLKDNRPGLRRLAAEGLGKIGPSVPGALPALKAAEKDPDDRVREAAALAVRRLESSK
jgi:HEAT repeat protein